MFLLEPSRTQYDLNFQLFGIPVRVHPLFWLMGLILGAAGGASSSEAALMILMWVAVLFVSILVHEFGHAFTMRYFGSEPRVVLYMMGGLAIPESSMFTSEFSSRTRQPWNWILISFAGPAAGFLLAGLVIAIVYLAGGVVTFDYRRGIIPWVVTGVDNPYLFVLIHSLLFINIFWGLVNLLPVYPLDGGQISRELFQLNDPWNGIVRSLWLSVFVGGFVAVVGGILLRDWFIALFFGLLAFSSYQMLQQFTGRGGGFGGGGYGGGGPW